MAVIFWLERDARCPGLFWCELQKIRPNATLLAAPGKVVCASHDLQGIRRLQSGTNTNRSGEGDRVAKKQSVIEDLIEITSRLKWHWGVGLATLAYLVLHHFATLPNPAPTSGSAMGQFAGRQLWISFASIFQYLLPICFLLGALVSAFKQWRAGRLHTRVAVAPARNALEAMSWREFEILVGETFRRKGFEVVSRGGKGPDGGVDVELRLGTDKYLVQCKQWKTQQVGVAVVRELFGVMSAEHAVGGFVVASGQFTDEARRFVEGRSIELVDTQVLLKMVQETQAAGRAVSPTRPVLQPEPSAEPACPRCGSAMALKRVKRGANAGQEFWGCTTYPVCRGTRSA
jgi:restriction system protein